MMLRKRAYSLIEVLVVIAILLIVAAIVAPVYAGAKKAAKISATISNLKQLHMAALLYQTESGAPGSYGPLSVSGLPASGDMRAYLQLFKSPCGRHPSDFTDYATVYYPGLRPDRYDEDAARFQENLIVVLDMQCSDPTVDLYQPLDPKFGLGILLSGALIRKTDTGDFLDPGWWADPMY